MTTARNTWSERLFARACKQYEVDELYKAARMRELKSYLANARLLALTRTEWSGDFEAKMRARLVMGALRYGTIAANADKADKWDVKGAVSAKLMLYEASGNTEYLVDAANYLMLAYLRDNHPNKHFAATDDVGHCQLRARPNYPNWRAEVSL